MKKGMRVLCVVLGAMAVGRAEAPSLFEQGNRAYQAGDFNGAREMYEKTVSEGLGGGALYYNLGNTYYRLGRWGKARLWYERAARELPGDEDVRHNRDLLIQQVGETSAVTDKLGEWEGMFWTLLMITNIGFFIVLAMSLFRESEALWWSGWIGGGGMVLFAALWTLSHHQAARRDAIVVASPTEVRAGPGTSERVVFVVPEGQRVVLIDRLGDWSQIGLPAKGLKGWAPTPSVEEVRFYK